MALPGLVAANNLIDVVDKTIAWDSLGQSVNVELAATNLVRQSERFHTAPWVASGATVTANAGTAPNGTLTADKLVPASGATGLGRSVRIAESRPNQYPYVVLSCFIKPQEFNTVTFRAESSDDLVSVLFNLANGLFTEQAGESFLTQIKAVGDGWFQVAMGATLPSASTVIFRITTGFGSQVPDGSSGLLLWGAQIIESPANFILSYVPTDGTAATALASGTVQVKGSEINNLAGVRSLQTADYVRIKGLRSLVQPRLTAGTTSTNLLSNNAANSLLITSPTSSGNYFLTESTLNADVLQVNGVNVASISGVPFSGGTATTSVSVATLAAPANLRIANAMPSGTLSNPSKAVPIDLPSFVLYAKAGES